MSSIESGTKVGGSGADYGRVLEAIYGELTKHIARDVRLEESTDILEDLAVDSVEVMDMLCALEEEFDVSIPLNTLSSVRTIEDLATAIYQAITETSS